MYGKLRKLFSKIDDEANAAGDKQNTNRVMSFGKGDESEERALGRERQG